MKYALICFAVVSAFYLSIRILAPNSDDAQSPSQIDAASIAQKENKSEKPGEDAALQTETKTPPETESGEVPLSEEFETKEEYFAHRVAELEKLEQTLSQQSLALETTILSAEMGLHEKSKSPPAPGLTPEEKELVRKLKAKIQAGDDQARSLFLASLNEDSSPAMYFIGGNLFAESGDNATAADFYMTALDTDIELSRSLKSRTNKNLGIILVKLGDSERSIPYLRQAIYLSNEPQAALLGLLGLSHFNTGNHAAAEYHYKQALALAPDKRDWHLGLAKTLLEQEKYQEAINHMNAMKLNPALGYDSPEN